MLSARSRKVPTDEAQGSSSNSGADGDPQDKCENSTHSEDARPLSIIRRGEAADFGQVALEVPHRM